MVTSPMPRRGRGRRPFADVQADVISAAVDVLRPEGTGGFTMDKVIAKSGVSSANVFNHCPSRGALALEAYVQAVGDNIAATDTDDICADLTPMVVAFVEMVPRIPEGSVFAQLIGAAQTDSDLAAQFDHHYFGPRRRNTFAVLAKSKERGQIKPDTDIIMLVDVIWGACYIRLLLPHLSNDLTSDLSAGFAHAVVDGALLGSAVDPNCR